MTHRRFRKRGTLNEWKVRDRALLKLHCAFTSCGRRFILCRNEDPGNKNMSPPEPIIRSRQTEKEVNGVSTQVVCTEFSNYIFIVLTQYGKIGTLVSVTPDSRSNEISTPMFSTKVLLGKDEDIRFFPYFTWNIMLIFNAKAIKSKNKPLTHVCAKNLATFVSQEAGNRPVLLGLSLKDSSLDSVNQMKEVIKSCQVW